MVTAGKELLWGFNSLLISLNVTCPSIDVFPGGLGIWVHWRLGLFLSFSFFLVCRQQRARCLTR